MRVEAITLAIMTAFVVPQANSADQAALLKDLSQAISVLGLPCGQVLSATKQAENDHLATCKDGNRYRVFINPQGRVVAQKQ